MNRRTALITVTVGGVELTLTAPEDLFKIEWSEPPVDPPGTPRIFRPEDFGAIGDGVADDTAAWRRCLDAAGATGTADKPARIEMEKGRRYLLSGTSGARDRPNGCLEPPSHVEIVGHDDSWLVMAPTDGRHNLSVLCLQGVRGVALRGFGIDGQYRSHTSVVVTQGDNGGLHCIAIRGGDQIALTDLVLTNAFTDGLSIDEGRQQNQQSGKGSPVWSVTLERVIFRANNRQGESIICCAGPVTHRHCQFIDTIGDQRPGAGVDIEANQEYDLVENLQYEDCIFNGNARAGFMTDIKGGELRNLTLLRCKVLGNKRADGVSMSFYGRGATVYRGLLIEDVETDGEIQFRGSDGQCLFENAVLRRVKATNVRRISINPASTISEE